MNLRSFLAMPALGLFGILALAYAAGYRGDIDLSEIARAHGIAEGRFVDAAGTRIHYTDMGDGPAVLLVHGTGAEIGAWQKFSRALAAKGYRVLALDLPGSGLSGFAPDGDYSARAGVSVVRRFLGSLGISRASVVGHSTGGQVAWLAALTEDPPVDRLVLVATTGYPHPSPVTWRLVQVPVLGEVMRGFTPRSVVRMNLEDAFHDDALATEALVDRYYHMIRREGARDALLSRMRAVSFEGHERVRCIARPTLVVWGEEDEWLPPAIGRWFADRIPGARLLLLPDVGHNVPEEADPRHLATGIAAWLEQPGPAPVRAPVRGPGPGPCPALRERAVRDGVRVR